MKKNKTEALKFMRWLRNGISICVTWFLLLMILCSILLREETIKVEILAKMIILTSGGVLLFCVFFTSLVIQKWSFNGRLMGFLLATAVYESVGFYWIGYFKEMGTFFQWCIFAAIVAVCYFITLGIYHYYSKSQGALYTDALHEYQNRR